MIIDTQCPTCKEWKSISVSARKYRDWKYGDLIQNCFPDLDAEDRERLMSGFCPKCFGELFAEPDEDNALEN